MYQPHYPFIIALSQSLKKYLNTCLDSKQNNITLTAGGGISIAQSPTSNWTITNLSQGLLHDNTDNSIIMDNLAETINLSMRLNVSNLSVVDELTTSTLIGNSTKICSIGTAAAFAHKIILFTI